MLMLKKKEKWHIFRKYLVLGSLLTEVTKVIVKIIDVVLDEDDDPFVIKSAGELLMTDY